MKKQFINSLRAGDDVAGIFYIVDKETRKTREGKDFFVFQLRDRTGVIKGLQFDVGPTGGVPKGAFAHVHGRISEYNGRLNLKIDEIWLAKESEVDYHDYLPQSDRDVEGCYRKLQETARSLREPIAALLTSFYDNKAFESQFKLAPAGVRAHHPYLGGLCIHTYDMLIAGQGICEGDPKIDRDLLYAGILLHDIGKIREYEYTRTIDNTDEGKMLGHITIGVRMIERELARMPEFPERLGWKLIHMVISHHGFMEFGSPRKPIFLEAEILHHLDNLDAKRAMYRELEARSDKGARWSEYHPYLERDVYLQREE
ncbi:HD domain-containing protein [candidate division WOR-3 bacterium]|nr:HD domain-containing protein [candidate division WOR-3 bacterium]